MSNEKKGNFLDNTVWLISGQILRLILSFFISTLTTRYLGPSNFGVVNYISSYIAFFTSIIGLGINGIIIHELVNHREESGKILGTAITFRFITSIICTIAFFTVVYLTDGNDKTMMVVAFLQAVQLPFLCLDTLNYWYQSNYQSKYPVIIQTIAYVVTSAYKVFLLVTGKSVEWFAFSMSLDISLISILYLAIYIKQKEQKLRYSHSVAKRLLKSCLPFILANIMTVIYGQMDRVMIKQMMGSDAQVGLYSAAITICTLISFIPIAILESGRPLVVEAKQNGDELYRLRFRQLAASIFWISALYSLFITVFSKLVIWLLYGEAYIPADMCLKIAVWYTAFSYLGSAMHLWLICEEKNKYVLVFCSAGAAGNLILNGLMIPLWGINGAAFATFITQFFTNFILPIFFKDTRPYTVEVMRAILLINVQPRQLISAFMSKLRRK